jgi:hypothetical protein
MKTLKVENLPAKENRTLTIQWDTRGLSPGVYALKAEAQPVPYESDLTDNIFVDGFVVINITGDVNGDGVVDIYDLAAVGLAFGATPDKPNWNPQADINGDNIIDIFDLVAVAVNFGRRL